MVEYVRKQTEYDKLYPIHYVYGFNSPRMNMPIGHEAAAALALFAPNKYDTDIAAYIHNLEHCDWFERMGKEMRGFWRRNKMTDDLPETFGKCPWLRPEFES